MKKPVNLFIAGLLAVTSLVSCTKNDSPQKWEYKVVSEWGIDMGSFLAKGLPDSESKLNTLGDEGWELVDVYTRIETVHPNFGNDKYVTGLQPNTRTEAVVFVFKRPKTESAPNDKKEDSMQSDVVVEEVGVVETVVGDTIPS
jgi:hypothetical protein